MNPTQTIPAPPYEVQVLGEGEVVQYRVMLAGVCQLAGTYEEVRRWLLFRGVGIPPEPPRAG